jgi:hypothetical protein
MSGLALIYQPEGYDPAARMMGRQVASAGLLKALARHWPTTRLTAVGPAGAAGPPAHRHPAPPRPSALEPFFVSLAPLALHRTCGDTFPAQRPCFGSPPLPG